MLTATLHDAARALELLKGDASGTIAAACIQATEAEHAARIQATATRQPGAMGALATLLAGLAAVAAGALAYRAAVTQAKIAQTAYSRRRLLYRKRMRFGARSALREINRETERLRERGDTYYALLFARLETKMPIAFELYSEMQPEKFELHSLLDTKQFLLLDRFRRNWKLIIRLCSAGKKNLAEEGVTAELERIKRLISEIFVAMQTDLQSATAPTIVMSPNSILKAVRNNLGALSHKVSRR